MWFLTKSIKFLVSSKSKINPDLFSKKYSLKIHTRNHSQSNDSTFINHFLRTNWDITLTKKVSSLLLSSMSPSAKVGRKKNNAFTIKLAEFLSAIFFTRTLFSSF